MKLNKLIVLIFVLGFLVRAIMISQYPAGLNADEAALGYNAYSIMTTGKDEHGASWPLVFRSFDDYKPPLYVYLTIPFIASFGLTPLAVRLPSVILGSFSIVLLYFLVNQLFANRKLAYLSALILAFSPWHIHFSRGGWEVNVSTFFTLLTIVLLNLSLSKPRLLILTGLASVLSIYTYHSARLITPLLLLSWFLTNRKPFLSLISRKMAVVAFSILVSLVTAMPVIQQMFSKEGQSRFNGVSVFSDSGPLWEALALRQVDGNGLVSRLLHNRYLTYSLRIVKNYSSHFSPRFLFIDGDEIARSRVPGEGLSLLVLFPFFFLGLLVCLQAQSPGKKFFLLWLLIAPVAASLTFQSPHALRAENMVVPLTFITALGVFAVLKRFRQLTIPFMVVFLLGFGSYAHQYYYHYPRELPYAWQYGFDQIASYTSENFDRYDKIVISDRYDQPYILMAFFLKYPPDKLQKEITLTPRDQFGFSTVRNFSKYEFRKIDYDQDKNLKNTLLMAADEYLPEDQVIKVINDPAGKPMYRFASTIP